jgi:catechol 2,3-dioxygenase-like lactoylglutathione lyase family enzyme
MSKTSANLTYIAPVFRVTDLSRSLAFYRDQLGFTVEFVYEGSTRAFAGTIAASI